MERLGGDLEKFRSLISILFFIHASAFAYTSEYFNSKHTPVVVEFGFEYLHPSFGAIDQVVIRNSQTSSEASTVNGGVNQTYPDVFAQTLKARILLNEERQAFLTLQTFLPLNALAQLDTGNTYLPEYVLYRAEKQRPRVSIMGEMKWSDSWRAGLGLDLGFGLTSEASVFLQSGAGKYSSQRISASVKPKIIPMFLIDFEGYEFLVKGENKVSMLLNASAGANVFPPLNASFDITYQTNSALFYDPWMFDLSKKINFSDSFHAILGGSYQLWSGYEARAAVINQVSGTFSNGIAPSFKAMNLFVPRIAIQQLFADQWWELMYEYKDSIFKTTPSGVGNYLDPPRHSFGLNAVFPFVSGWELGVGLQVARLAPQTVVKSDSTEIGAPGYQASGWLYGGRVSLTVPFEVKKL